jgi:hypothetical protein
MRAKWALKALVNKCHHLSQLIAHSGKIGLGEQVENSERKSRKVNMIFKRQRTRKLEFLHEIQEKIKRWKF